MRTTTLIATVVPLGRRGHYSVYLGDRMLLSASRTPLLDAARELMRIGNDPDAFLVMRRLSAGHDDMRARPATAPPGWRWNSALTTGPLSVRIGRVLRTGRRQCAKRHRPMPRAITSWQGAVS
jgi:hypothetical protein